MADVIVNGSLEELTFKVNGEDIMTSLLESEGRVSEYVDGHDAYRLTEDEFEWWSEWVRVENLVCDAWEAADEDTRERHARLVSEYGHDLEMLHDMECELFGIER